MNKFDVITFGSATWDVFINPTHKQILHNKKFVTGKGICFNLGSKVDIADISFASGGGATNTAATFSAQGHKVAYCGSLGDDLASTEIMGRLKNIGIDCSLVKRTNKAPTNHSIVINSGSDRTILVYKGASEHLSKNDIDWKKLNASWFYLAPLSGKLAGITEDIVNFAKVNGIKVALNPGSYQLKLKNINRIISKVDVLLLNKEEASVLTKLPYREEKKIFRAIDKICPGIAIMTKGTEGVIVSDGIYIYRAGISKSKVVDRTGAGDSFGSGFVSGLIENNDIEYAIELAMANSAACLAKRGAKEGLLKKGAKFKGVKIKKKKI